MCIQFEEAVINNKTNKGVFISIGIIALLFFLLLPRFSVSQTDDRILSNASYAEKIYLQLDTKTYTLGNIVWFKCVVLNASDHFPSELSRILYVELITPDETFREKKLIKIEGGIGQGFFFLDKNMDAGLYQIRAYTEWNKNFGTDFIFEEYIHVFANKQEEKSESPISNVTLVKERDNSNRLKAIFNPYLIDSLQKKNLTVIVAIDDNKDTLEIKSDKDDQYLLDMEINEDSHFATIQIQTENDKRFTKTIVLNEDILDLQFFPESGEMVHGLQCKVGFKALDANGQGKRVEGDIVDERDSVITSFKSNILGMGSLIISRPDSTQTYYAKLKTSEKGEVLMYPLPKAVSKGNTMIVERKGENINIVALSNYIRNDSIKFSISCRGVILYNIPTVLNNGVSSIIIPVVKLPEGIVAFTVKDKFNQPVAERLYFVERPESRIDLSLTTDKVSYTEREETKLEILAENHVGDPLNANLSVLVINKKQLGAIQDTRQNILSYFLLESELKGKIENPGYYFDGDTSRQNDLDALMLTQGWRKYHYSKEYEEFHFKAERSLVVSGQIGGLINEKKSKEADLILIAFGKEENKAYEKSTDSLGNFRFNLIDTYGGTINAIIQTNKKNSNGKQVNYSVTLDEKQSPPITFEHERTIEKLDSVIRVLVEQNIERSKIDEAFPLDSGNIMIEEVEVTALKLTPERKKVIDAYGEPTRIIDGAEIEAKEQKWSFGLFSVLMYEYPDLFRISVSPSGQMFGRIHGADLTLFVVDGEPVKIDDYSLLPGFPISEVSSFEITRNAKNFVSLCIEVFGFPPPPDVLEVAVIAIYTHGVNGIFARSADGITKTNINVFSASREFYAPKYNNMKEDEWRRPDLRALIHWAPELKTDENGKASLSFYNADIGGEMMIVVEAISEYGNIGYKKLEYNVEGKENGHVILN